LIWRVRLVWWGGIGGGRATFCWLWLERGCLIRRRRCVQQRRMCTTYTYRGAHNDLAVGVKGGITLPNHLLLNITLHPLPAFVGSFELYDPVITFIIYPTTTFRCLYTFYLPDTSKRPRCPFNRHMRARFGDKIDRNNCCCGRHPQQQTEIKRICQLKHSIQR